MAPVATRAVLLRGYDYGDSSRILRFYTRELGLLSVVAKGVRGRSGKGTTAMSNFATGDLTAYVKPQRDLHTMKDFACTRLREELGREVLRFAGASAAGELVLAHAEAERQPGVFEAVERALDGLAEAPTPRLPATVLSALWTITEAFGFAPQLAPCVRCHRPLGADEVGRFDFAAGGVRCAECGQDMAGPRVGPGARAQLADLLTGTLPDDFTHPRQHLALVSDFIAYHVASKPLKSLQFLGGLMPVESGVVDDG
ncbi:MAG: DNA repair protein RecO [Gemmatimonadota bacterium]|nr:DNA repair protein RecO [Gemmatimonadota bacterium]